MNHIALKIEFETDRFRLSGPLPEDINAGNQCYGEDLARWICESLPAWHLSHGDEDWGWEAFSTRGKAPQGIDNQICVHGFPTEDRPGDDGLWMLYVHQRKKLPWLRFFSRWQYIRFDEQLGRELLQAIRGIGARNIRATVVYLDKSGNEIKEEPMEIRKRS